MEVGFKKYLAGVLLAFCFVSSANGNEMMRTFDFTRGPRRLFDMLFGRLRPCFVCTCGKSNRGGAARFLGGEFTDTHEFPWLANVLAKNGFLASGVLVNDRYVLTSASRLLGITPPEIKVALGEYDRCNLDVSSANVSVEAVIFHPEFSRESRAHDLALLRLSRSNLFEKRIQPICLPDEGSTYLGQVGTVAGWADVGGSSGPSDGDDAEQQQQQQQQQSDQRTCRPRKLGIPILGRRECLKGGVRPQMYHDASGCAGIVGVADMICQNDAGTPVMHRSYSGFYDLVGILPDNNYCNGTVGTAIFTRIGPYVDWIYQKTRDACYCLRPLDIPEIKFSMFAY